MTMILEAEIRWTSPGRDGTREHSRHRQYGKRFSTPTSPYIQYMSIEIPMPPPMIRYNAQAPNLTCSPCASNLEQDSKDLITTTVASDCDDDNFTCVIANTSNILSKGQDPHLTTSVKYSPQLLAGPGRAHRFALQGIKHAIETGTITA
ncbi:hypothetical protein O1611_g1259 [Lasiodiplodia mahajangana]|uniref:Uncharacterized protein n=1 Tax=Lasiodiplodia mahajangana TaxID=1108764 RepID=A0ACC2JXX5_9PEZI|nr:hypothetical protein O1611_g1259 [Lasiodiplodia mahajangana]